MPKEQLQPIINENMHELELVQKAINAILSKDEEDRDLDTLARLYERKDLLQGKREYPIYKDYKNENDKTV